MLAKTQRRKGKRTKRFIGKELGGLAAWRENNNCTQRRGDAKKEEQKGFAVENFAAWRLSVRIK